jgi:hypothetical protein
MTNISETQLYDCFASKRLLRQDPSLSRSTFGTGSAFAQDDSEIVAIKGGKNGGCAAILSSPLPKKLRLSS